MQLADILGNLVNRSLSFIERHFEGRVPSPAAVTDSDRAVLAEIEAAAARIGGSFEEFQARRAAAELMDLARTGNRYFNNAAPWFAIKQDRQRCAAILYTTVQLEAALAVLMEPMLPFSAERLWKMLAGPGSHRDCRWSEIPALRLSEGHRLGAREILFNKIEDSVIDAQIARLRAATPA